METLKKIWTDLAEKYCLDNLLIDQCFDKLQKAYSEKHRYYHNIEHIKSMLMEINSSKNYLDKQDELLFAAWFHDIIYNPKKHDNEGESAEAAVKMLKQLSVPDEKIQKVKELILATANHTNNLEPDSDLSFFLDCDLKVLGTERKEYLLYAQNIRKEYKHVLSFLYSRERKKILKRFIESPTIYRTEYFRNKYEEQAKSNILFEIQNL